MKIGPVLGILTIPRSGSNPFVGGQNESFTEILDTAERMNCVAYVFSPFEIDWSKNAVWGYHWKTRTGEWERHLFPLPSVIYNRIPNRTMEKRDDISGVLSLLRRKYGSRFFNPFFLDKWETHQILYSNKHTLRFLPDTVKLETPDSIDAMIQKFGAVYLKPTANSLGNEIIRVQKKGRSYHYYHQKLDQAALEGKADNCKELLSQVNITEESPEYLVQRAIPLAKCPNRFFDLRLLVQKGPTGKWGKTGIAARVSGSGSITTHVFYGGSRYCAEEALKRAAETHNFPVEKVKQQLKKIQTAVPKAIEAAYKHSFGELEMDVGIDRKGKVWFFEANSKPFRFDEKLIRAKSLVRLIHYSYFLDSRI